MRRLPRVPQGGRRGDRHGGLLSPTVGIVTTGHDVADARLHRTVAALRRAGCDVWVRGLGDAAGGPPGATVVTAPRRGALVRLARALTWPLRGRADVLMTIDPDTALAAWIRPGRWVADVHEDYRELLLDRPWVPRPLLVALRGAVAVLNRLISRADLVLVADDHVPPRAPRRYVMRNEPDPTVLPAMADRPVHPPAGHGGGPGFRAVYIGDNRTSRGLRDMIEAVAATKDDDHPWSLDLVGPIAPADRAWFDERMSQPDTSRITFHDRRPPAEAWRIAEGADVGLCLLADTPAFREAVPSKVYEYLAMGLPTVATPLPRVRQLLDDAGAGLIVDDAAAATGALRVFAADAAHRDRLVTNARRAGVALRTRPSTYDQAARRIVATTA